ncbi:MAG: hypothetical protein IJ036_02475 [Lachnospiraceae bacterium]|nr:hypothetical protein [Lachnospiraceae bacterium]
MERAEFQQKLIDISNLAKQQGRRLTMQEVRGFFAELSLTEEQMKLVYEYLTANQIVVEGYVPEKQEEEIPYTREELQFLQTYEKELNAVELLTEEKLEPFLKQAEEGVDIAKAKVIAQRLHKVLEQAKTYRGRGLPLDDLVQEGNMGLILSMETLGLRPAGMTALEYAHGEVDRALRRALEEDESQRQESNQIVDKVNKLSDSITQLTEDLERQVTVEELSAFLDMSVEEIEDILKLAGDDIEVADEEELQENAALWISPVEEK